MCVWCWTHLWQVWWCGVVAADDLGILPCRSSCLHVPVWSDPSDPSAALDRHQSAYLATGPADCSVRAVGTSLGPADVPQVLGVGLGECQACCAHQQLTCPVVTKCLCLNYYSITSFLIYNFISNILRFPTVFTVSLLNFLPHPHFPISLPFLPCLTYNLFHSYPPSDTLCSVCCLQLLLSDPT